jgi:hypothetical protein
MIDIKSNTTWTITAPAWVTNAPLTGSGNFQYTPITSANGTGTYKTGTITITYGDGSVETRPIIQYAGALVMGRIFILGLDDDAGQVVNFSVVNNSGTLNSTDLGCGESIDITNYPQSGIIPVNGETVTVKVDTRGDVKNFSPNFGNKIYRLTTATYYATGEEVIAGGASAVSLSLSTGIYSGTFTYSANDYFYLVFDFRNVVLCSGSTNMGITGSFYPVNIDVDYGTSAIGNATIGLTLGGANNASVTYNGSNIGGFTEDISGSYIFYKNSLTEQYARIIVSNGDSSVSGDITLVLVCVSLTSFSLVTTGYSTSALSCAGSVTTATKYHNGASALPAVGDIIFDDSLGATTFDGNNQYWKELTGTDNAYLIDSNGFVQTITSCVACAYGVKPTITTIGTMYVEVNQELSVQLQANQTILTWQLTSSYYNYTITGNTLGGRYTYVNTEGVASSLTIGKNEQINVSGNTLTLVSGDATFVSNGYYLQNGVSIENDGVLYVNFPSTGTFTIQVVATSCYVTPSDAKTFTFVVNAPVTLTSFKMSTIGYDSSVSACASTDGQNDFWFHSSVGSTYPVLNDIIYIDGYQKDFFNGSYMYYLMDNNYWILINSAGQVVDKGIC